MNRNLILDSLRIEIGQKKLRLKNAEFSVKIAETSRPDIISLDGRINPQQFYETVSLTLEIAGFEGVCVQDIELLVPAKVAKQKSINEKVDYCRLRYGIFMHWIAGDNKTKKELTGWAKYITNTKKYSGISEYVELCDVDAICTELKELGFEFLNLTNFHGLGITSHPSVANDFWRGKGVFSAKRDLVRELIDGLKKQGLYLSLFTHPLDGHDFSKEEQELLGFNDPTDHYKRWNDFINDVYGDLASKYGNDIIAMGFDSEFGQSGNEEWLGKLDLIRLRKTIQTYAPYLPLVSLSPSNDLTGYSLKEAWRPSWLDPWMERGNHSSDYEGEYDVEDWPCYYRPIAVVITKHWTTITPKEEQILYVTPEQMFRYTVMQIASSLEGPGLMWGNSSYIDGGWEKGVKEAFAKVNEYMDPIREGLKNVYPSSSYFLKEGTKLGELPNGICATRSDDERFEYIHILHTPKTNVLVLPLPQDGKVFINAVCLNNGEKVKITQDKDVQIEIPKDMEWNKLCTTIKMKVDKNSKKPKSKAFHKNVTYSSSVVSDNLQNCPYTHIRLVDGISDYIHKKESWATDIGGWQSKAEDENPWITVDMFKKEKINQVILHFNKEIGDLPKEINILVSDDNKKFSSIFKTKTVTEKTDCKFPVTTNRYVKAEFKKNYKSVSLCEIEIF